ncbi:MAG: 23S rRNA (uracil(1939)-C(5))-methyltransferase RlmD [bacterium]
MNPPSPLPEAPVSPPESAARCRHFGWCGGCATQDVPYEAQVARKDELLAGLLAPWKDALRPIEPSPSPWFYRNKMEFAFGFDHDRLALGLRRKGRFYGVVNLEECFLMNEAVPRILNETRSWAEEHALPPYHLRRHEGLLRYLVLRDGKRTGHLMAILVTAPPPDAAAFTATLAGLAERLRGCGVTSVLWSVTDRQADLAVGEIRATPLGEPRFEERLAGVDFSLSPYAFFQPNVVMAERLIERARIMLESGWPMLVDLYSGVGGITLALAPQAKRAIGIELEAAAVEDATANAARNGVANCQFVAEDSLVFLRRFSNYSFLSDKWAVVLDPPRAGMHPKMAAQLLRVAPPVMLYVSCNPKKLAEDLGALTGAYRLDEAVPYDFFPHTPHVEVLAKLTRR